MSRFRSAVTRSALRWAGLGGFVLWAGLALAQSAPGADTTAPTAAAETVDAALVLEQAHTALRRLKRAQAELEQSMQRIARRAQVPAQGREFSRAVIEQLRQLPRPDQFAGLHERRDAALKQFSDANLRVANELARSADIDAAVELELARLLPEQRDAAKEPLRRQLLERRHMLTGLEQLQTELIDALQSSEKAQSQLLHDSAAARDELSRLLFWVPARPGRAALGELGPAWAWMSSGASWHGAARALPDMAERRPLTPLLALAASLLLFAARQRLKRWLVALAPARRPAETHCITHTVVALGLTLALALPGALLLWALSLVLAGGSEPSVFVLALSDAASMLAALWLGFAVLVGLLERGGVVTAHLGSDEATAGFTARSLRAAMWLFLPLMFVATLNGMDHAPFASRESLGRLSFMLAMLVLAALLVHVLRRSSLPMSSLRLREPNSGLLKWHGAWFSLLLALPLGIALLALAGYFVAAGYFFGRMVYTGLLIGGALMLYGLMAQWVHLQRARLVRAERDVQAQAALEADVDTPGVTHAPRIDIAALGEQTRSLFDLLITLLLLVGVWLIWKDSLPVLSVIGDYALWHYQGNVDGKPASLPLTVGHLFLTLLVAAVTALLMRNSGALLDIVLLQRLQMQADATYAIKVVAGYLIAALGVAIASSILGIGWTDVHWLVAALGVGLGFGLQEIFANFVSGLIVLAERPIRIGDVVSVGEVTGKVMRIRARATAVLDFDNKEVIIPNKAFITERVVNWTLSNSITRLLTTVGVAYGSDVAAVQRLLIDAVKATPDVLAEPAPTVYFVGFGDSSLDFEMRAFVDAFDKRLRVRHAINQAVGQALAAQGIEIPFPQRELHIRPAPGVHCDVQAAQAG